jgi:hypothetical protein
MGPIGPIQAIVALIPMVVWFFIMTIFAIIRLFLNKEMNCYHCYCSSVLFIGVFILGGAWVVFGDIPFFL